MKVGKGSVSSTGYAGATAAYGKAKRVQAPAAVNDSVEVSPSAALFQKAVGALGDVPDIRTEAISGIQQELDEGRYQRDERVVAERLIDDHIISPTG